MASPSAGSSSGPPGPSASTSASTHAHSSRSPASAARVDRLAGMGAVVGHLRPHRRLAAPDGDVEPEAPPERLPQARGGIVEPHERAHGVEADRVEVAGDRRRHAQPSVVRPVVAGRPPSPRRCRSRSPAPRGWRRGQRRRVQLVDERVERLRQVGRQAVVAEVEREHPPVLRSRGSRRAATSGRARPRATSGTPASAPTPAGRRAGARRSARSTWSGSTLSPPTLSSSSP